jgi:hypothetical protein
VRKLVLKQEKCYHAPYEVIGMEDTTKWDIGERLSKLEVEQIMANYPTTSKDGIKIVIK